MEPIGDERLTRRGSIHAHRLADHGQPLEELDRHIDEHITYLREECVRGTFFAFGRNVPRTGRDILSGPGDGVELKGALEREPCRVGDPADYTVTERVPITVADDLGAPQEA